MATRHRPPGERQRCPARHGDLQQARLGDAGRDGHPDRQEGDCSGRLLHRGGLHPGQPDSVDGRGRPDQHTPFGKGLAEAITRAIGYDTPHDEYVFVTDTSTVRLTRS